MGAIGLKRRGQGWLTWAAIGTLGIIFALALLAGGLFALNLMVWIIMIGAGLRGAALLLVALKASRTPGRRWVLVLDGLLSVAIAVALLIWPLLGARLLRYAVGGYLTASGVSSLAFAYGNHGLRAPGFGIPSCGGFLTQFGGSLPGLTCRAAAT